MSKWFCSSRLIERRASLDNKSKRRQGINTNKSMRTTKTITTTSNVSTTVTSNNRVILTGIGGVGKSTLFRQIQADWSEKTLTRYRPVVHGCVIVGIKMLLEHAERLASSHPTQRTSLQRSNSSARRFVKHELAYDDTLTNVAGRHIARLWNDAGIRRTYELRARFGLPFPHSTAYFLEQIDELCKSSYVPSINDVLQLEVRSTGIVDANIVSTGGSVVQLLDIGGQRQERAKWQRCNHNVRAVVYVFALSDFDEVMLEDGKTSRFNEALAVFEELVNSSFCKNKPMIVVFNKIDLLAAKMRRLRLNDFFPSFQGGSDVEKAVHFFRQLILSRVDKGGAIVTDFISVATDRSRSSAAINGLLDEISNPRSSKPSRVDSVSRKQIRSRTRSVAAKR